MSHRRPIPSPDRVRSLRAEGLSWPECGRILGFSGGYLNELFGDGPKRGRTCTPHRVGVPVDARPFFVPGCPVCEAKKAAGDVTGNEAPPDFKGWKQRKHIENFPAKMAKIKAGRDRDRKSRQTATWNP